MRHRHGLPVRCVVDRLQGLENVLWRIVKPLLQGPVRWRMSVCACYSLLMAGNKMFQNIARHPSSLELKLELLPCRWYNGRGQRSRVKGCAIDRQVGINTRDFRFPCSTSVCLELRAEGAGHCYECLCMVDGGMSRL